MKFYSTKVSHQNGIMQAIQSLSKRSTVTNLSGNNSEAGTLLKKFQKRGPIVGSIQPALHLRAWNVAKYKMELASPRC